MKSVICLCIALHLIDASVIPSLISSHHLASGHRSRNGSDSSQVASSKKNLSDGDVYVLREARTAPSGRDIDGVEPVNNAVKFIHLHDDTTLHYDVETPNGDTSTTSTSPPPPPSSTTHHQGHHSKHRESRLHGENL